MQRDATLHRSGAGEGRKKCFPSVPAPFLALAVGVVLFPLIGCGAPSSPTPPPDFSDYPASILEYMNAGGTTPSELFALLDEWGLMTGEGVMRAAELDGTRGPEWVLILPDSTRRRSVGRTPGELIVLDGSRGDPYRIIYRSSHDTLEPFRFDIRLMEISDLNANGKADLAFTGVDCAHLICLLSVSVVEWDGSALVPITDGRIEIPYPTYMEWLPIGDSALGPRELHLETGYLADRGWGPRRPWVEIWRWNGEAFTKSQIREAESDLLAFRVLDGHKAQLEGDLDRADALFRDAAINPCLQASEWIFPAQNEIANFRAFSHFRLVVIALAQGDPNKASSHLKTLEANYPGHEFSTLAELFWERGGAAGDLRRACGEVQDYAQNHPEILTLLNFGYESPGFKPEDLCGVAGEVENR